MTRCRTVFLLALLALLQGCASTRAVSSWQLPLAGPHPRFQHLYVIALTPVDAVAIQLEQALVERLRDAGVAATAARQDFSAQELREPAVRERIAGRVKASGADGVLLVAYQRKAEKQVYVPPSTTTLPLPPLPPPPVRGGYPAYIGYQYEVIYQPGYYTTSTEYYMASTLYQVGKDAPVWTAQSATVDPDTVAAGVRSFTKTLVRELGRAGALDPAPR